MILDIIVGSNTIYISGHILVMDLLLMYVQHVTSQL